MNSSAAQHDQDGEAKPQKDYQLLEIEDPYTNLDPPVGVMRSRSKLSNASKISVSLFEVSCVSDKDTNEKSGYIKGILLMATTTLIWTIIHISIKYMFSISPNMSAFDSISVVAYSLVPFYYIYAKIEKVNVNIFSFTPKMRLVILLRVAVGLLNNICLFFGLQYVSIGKGILIWSMSPLFCTITAAIFLKEKITFQNIGLILFSIFGVYLLTLNKSEDPEVASNEILGYCLLVTSAFLYGLLFVILRTMSLNNVHTLISPLYFGLGTLLQNIFIMIFMPGLLHFEEYKGTNLICLGILFIGVVAGQFTFMASTKYTSASGLAPIAYSENIFTILADIVIFNYHFIFTDMIGIVIIALCLVIPIVQKIKE
ncbi:unnamed protein product [Moneuplotes crassus]|uniref:EamA domain-containing protein n=2 Tax=Euplotes crassus TaxID=5936 RepID=A0AAD1XHV1_EUPCR|nr:unnamed protein product [Moneuplotes crassus]